MVLKSKGVGYKPIVFEWVTEVLAAQVKSHFEEQGVPLKALLVIDNVLLIPRALENLMVEHDLIQIKLLPARPTNYPAHRLARISTLSACT